MILDSSAVVAILLREPGFERLIAKLGDSSNVGIGAPTLLETSIVLNVRLQRDPRLLIGQFLREANVTVVPFGEEHWAAAIDAFLRYGKGRHPAGLNFGDCMSYAVARLAGLPLLFVGDDFAKTDVSAA